MCPPAPGEVAAQGVEGWGPGPPRISERATSSTEVSTEGKAETDTAPPDKHLAHLGAEVG